jgi:hypothetical protein
MALATQPLATQPLETKKVFECEKIHQKSPQKYFKINEMCSKILSMGLY